MTVHHHLTDEIVVAHAAGTLSEGWQLAVETHLALCPHCRRRLAAAEAVGGAMLAAAEPAPTTERSLAAVMARIDDAAAEPAPIRVAQPAGASVYPEPLRSYLGSVEALRWQSLGNGARQLLIRTGDNHTRARLLQIPAGKPMPRHGHRGSELTVVLAGAFRDGDTLFVRGDVETADEDLEHQPIATEDGDCICLAVTDAPLRFNSLIARILQPFFRI